jgi:hypothetical protein
LKNRGVYPNNRLVVARRFPSGVGNDLTEPNLKSPMATMISWVPDGQNMLEGMTFGEEWVEAEASITEILNSIGKDVLGKNLGDKIDDGLDTITLPGFSEGLQIDIMKQLGMVDKNNSPVLPLGNPNLIKNAMRRKVVDKDKPGSGLKYEFQYKMKVEYKQQYINGIDNTLVYFDFLANILSFATSESQFMYTQAFAQGSGDFLKKLISGDINQIISSIKDFIKVVMDIITANVKDLTKNIVTGAKAIAADPSKAASGATSLASTVFSKTIGPVIGKYRIKILGVINALTGVPSAPWHLTIGNPKKPFFCSGDMVLSNSTITFGPTLLWNDLPSEITIDFTLKNARPCGAQEIFNKFNTGKARSYSRNYDDISTGNNNITDDAKNAQSQQTAYDKAQVSNKNNTDNKNSLNNAALGKSNVPGF